MRAANLSPATQRTYLAAISCEHLEAFMEHQLANWKPATAANRYSGIRPSFTWLVEEGELRESPMARMRRTICSFEVMRLARRKAWHIPGRCCPYSWCRRAPEKRVRSVCKPSRPAYRVLRRPPAALGRRPLWRTRRCSEERPTARRLSLILALVGLLLARAATPALGAIHRPQYYRSSHRR